MTSSMDSAQASAERLTAREKLALRVRHLLGARFDANHAIEFLSEATAGDLYVCGGVIRRALLGDSIPGDIDIMIPNGDERALDALDALNVPFVLNSQKHRRYRWNYLEIDIFQPREFFSGFEDIESALRFFDLRINALALHWRSNRILDPFDTVSGRTVTNPGINWPHWLETNPQHVVVLAIRLAKILHEAPALSIPLPDAQRLVKDVVPRIRDCNWDNVQQRFPLGKAAFPPLFERIVLKGRDPNDL